MMKHSLPAAALALVLAAAVSGCAAQRACTSAECADDAKITAAVQSGLDQRPDLGPPGTIRVQTINGVVYISGEVDTDPERLTAQQVANGVDGVKKVVNMVAVKNFGH